MSSNLHGLTVNAPRITRALLMNGDYDQACAYRRLALIRSD